MSAVTSVTSVSRPLSASSGIETLLAGSCARIDHIAIAVPDLEACLAWYVALGFTVLEQRETRGETTGMISAVLRAGPVTFVLVQGTSEASQVSRFVARHGPGVQHVAIAVDDLDALVGRLSEAGFELATPVLVDGGLRQAFLQRHPASGVMIELIERSGHATFSDHSVERMFRQLEARGLY